MLRFPFSLLLLFLRGFGTGEVLAAPRDDGILVYGRYRVEEAS